MIAQSPSERVMTDGPLGSITLQDDAGEEPTRISLRLQRYSQRQQEERIPLALIDIANGAKPLSVWCDRQSANQRDVNSYSKRRTHTVRTVYSYKTGCELPVFASNGESDTDLQKHRGYISWVILTAARDDDSFSNQPFLPMEPVAQLAAEPDMTVWCATHSDIPRPT
jgi:hypothetical protein